VTLPLVWPGAVAGTVLAFVIALGEYVASVLVFCPANRPISIAIASELRDFNLGAAAAYGVVLIVDYFDQHDGRRDARRTARLEEVSHAGDNGRHENTHELSRRVRRWAAS
jgi:hypothetical protein